MNESLKFVKLKEDAAIPNKNDGDAGYDVWGCYDNKFIMIPPHSIEKIPTGIASVIPNGYVGVLKERSSMGSKHITVHCGIIDSSYRGEWLVCVSNDSNKPVVFYDDDLYDIEDDSIVEVYKICGWGNDAIYIPKSKAICQMLLLPVPEMSIEELSMSEFKTYITERGDKGFGSTDAR